jgi:hypothetical protein
MFAPGPDTSEGWLVVVGRRRDGRDEDLMRGGEPPWSRRPDDSALHPNARGRTYTRAVWHRRPPVRRAYADWMCRRNPELVSVTIFYVKDVPATASAPARGEPVQIAQRICAEPPG